MLKQLSVKYINSYPIYIDNVWSYINDKDWLVYNYGYSVYMPLFVLKREEATLRDGRFLKFTHLPLPYRFMLNLQSGISNENFNIKRIELMKIESLLNFIGTSKKPWSMFFHWKQIQFSFDDSTMMQKTRDYFSQNVRLSNP